MKPKIFISAPMTVPMEHLCNVRDLLHEEYDIPNLHISYWDRKSLYVQEDFDSSDAVIFILNDFAFEGKEGSIPIGVDKELRDCDLQGKSKFLAYRLKSTGSIRFYEFSVELGPNKNYNKTRIKGISDTSYKFEDFVKRSGSLSGFDNFAKSLKEKGQKEFLEIDVQSEFVKSAHNMIQNSAYGALGTLDNPSYGWIDPKWALKKWEEAGLLENTDPTEQVKLPTAKEFYAKLITNPDYPDERLLLML